MRLNKFFAVIIIICIVLLVGCQKKNSDSQSFKDISKSQIEKVEVSALNIKEIYLTDDEITSLVSLLNKSKDFQEYKGPTPKGGALSFNIFLKSKEEMTLFSYENGFLLFLKDKRYKVKQQDYEKFAASIFSKYRDVNIETN